MSDLFYPKKIAALALLIFLFTGALAQNTQFSFATDVNLLRSLRKDQQYWAIGQTINFNFHFTRRDGAYAWLSYYSDGKFSNVLAADAKSSTTVPQQIIYQNKSQLRFKHISLGWKRYLKGRSDAETGWNMYGFAGFGLMIGRVINTYSTSIDTSMYFVPVLNGKGRFKRLTLDLGLGCEFPAGADVFLYFETRALVPTTDYPSPYLFVNENAPFIATVNAGVRILFR